MGGIAIEWAHIPTAKSTGDSVRFKAFVTTFNESYQSDWNQEHVYGRMDPIESFRSTRRTISLGWTVVAHSPQEGSENLSKVSKLLKFLYPTYSIQNKAFNESGFGVISAAPLLRLKFMNLIQNAPRGATAATSIANAFSSDSQSSYGSVQNAGLIGRVDGFNVNHELDDGFFMGNGPTATPKEYLCRAIFIQFMSMVWVGMEIRNNFLHQNGHMGEVMVFHQCRPPEQMRWT